MVEGNLDSNVWYNLSPITSDDIVIAETPSNTGGATFVNSKYVSVKVYKWFDANNDGLKGTDALEPALANWDFSLLGSDGTGKTGTTGADGYYTFTKLPAGKTWTATETLKDGWYEHYWPVRRPSSQVDVGTITPVLEFGNRRPLDIIKTINGAPIQPVHRPEAFTEPGYHLRDPWDAAEGVLGTCSRP